MFNFFMKKQVSNPFHVDFPNWQSVTKETAQFIFIECEKRLNNSMLIFDNHREKAFRILGFLLPVLIAVVGYSLSIDYVKFPEKLLPSVLFCSLQIIGMILFIMVIVPRSFATIGFEPKEIMLPSTIIDDANYQQIALLLAVCERIQDKINSNRDENNRASNLILWGLIFSAILAPIAFFTSFLLV